MAAPIRRQALNQPRTAARRRLERAELGQQSHPVTLRIDLGIGFKLGPGKIALLEAIARTRSISAAARELDMSYRRAWLLIDQINAAFAAPVVLSHPGRTRGGTELTALGIELVSAYRDVERLTASLVSRRFARFGAGAPMPG